MARGRKALLQSLFALASIEFQTKYIDNADADVYTSPEELLEDLSSACIEAQSFKEEFTQDELERCEAMRDKIKSLPNEDIYKTPLWEKLREEAKDFLNFMGYNVSDIDDSIFRQL
ncbi:hypothetical protein [uncultured Campylobacter sp.]|uniref:hypothetical protein n=1 Tax=uncultured Campylobacter sp. TaxID=218934 RepID=UPI0026369362|nr:hypothetical protein [uncultured Campylobacter sp.]